MGLFAAGQVVVLPFPYSDLTGNKLRPVLLLASAKNDDWVLCQITSNPYSDPSAVPIIQTSFSTGGLRHTSYLRPAKLFTAHESLIVSTAGTLTDVQFEHVLDAVIAVFR